MERESEGDWYYQQIELGMNYRMTDIQAALGISQMSRLDECVARRHTIMNRYNERLRNLPIELPYQDKSGYSALHLYPIKLDTNKLTRSKQEIFQKLRANGIGVNVHYIPIHTQPVYQRLGFKKGDFPNAEHYYERAISIPMYSAMTQDQQDAVISVLEHELI